MRGRSRVLLSGISVTVRRDEMTTVDSRSIECCNLLTSLSAMSDVASSSSFLEKAFNVRIIVSQAHIAIDAIDT